MEGTIISRVARLRSGPLILMDALSMKKAVVMLSKNKNSGPDCAALYFIDVQDWHLYTHYTITNGGLRRMEGYIINMRINQ